MNSERLDESLQLSNWKQSYELKLCYVLWQVLQYLQHQTDRQTDRQTASEDISFWVLLLPVILWTLVMSLTVSSDILKAWCFLWCFQLSSWCVFRPVSRESQSLGGRGRSDIPCCWSSPKTWSKRVSKCSSALISPLQRACCNCFSKAVLDFRKALTSCRCTLTRWNMTVPSEKVSHWMKLEAARSVKAASCKKVKVCAGLNADAL